LDFSNIDHKALKDLAHSLKGSSAYVGASRLHYACYYLQDYYIAEKFQMMVDHFPNLVEAAVEFRLYSRKVLAENKDPNNK
jgi:HPt (histidine-containing phosphotransfer) domain-containing protein